MTDMAELRRRKEPLNLAIVHVDPQAFAAHLVGWLEITSCISEQRTGAAPVAPGGVTPALSKAQMSSREVEAVGADAVFAFAITASLAHNKPAFDSVDNILSANLGSDYPGAAALKLFRDPVETPATLEEHVGRAGNKLLNGDLPPPPLRAKENWSAGLRFFEKARKSNFVHEIMYPLAKWTRACGTEILEKGVAFLQHIEDNVPILRQALDDPRNDQAFTANFLLKLAPAVDMELMEEFEGLLRSIARR